MHLANDFLYGIAKFGSGIRVTVPLTAPSTCLANDQGYDAIFSHQLAVLAGDLALALSGSGNSSNVVNGLTRKNGRPSALPSSGIQVENA